MRRIKISNNWTPVEKLKIVIIMTDGIRDDINAGNYFKPGKPNIQSVHEFIIASPAELESYRDEIEKMVNDSYTRNKIDTDEWFKPFPWE